MMKQLFFVLFLATVVLMEYAKGTEAEAEGGNEENGENGSSMTTLATASLFGLAFNILMNVWQ